MRLIDYDQAVSVLSGIQDLARQFAPNSEAFQHGVQKSIDALHGLASSRKWVPVEEAEKTFHPHDMVRFLENGSKKAAPLPMRVCEVLDNNRDNQDYPHHLITHVYRPLVDTPPPPFPEGEEG